MFNTQFSVPDIAHTARCHTELAAEGMGVAIEAGNASVDVSGRLAWNLGTGFGQVEISKRDYVTAKEKTQMCIDMRILLGLYSFYVYISKLAAIIKNNKMKTLLLIWIVLLMSSNASSQNESMIYSKIDSLDNVYKNSFKKQDSLIQSLVDNQKNFQIKESLFTNQLAILTAIFSAIVAISIFIIGYLLPKQTEAKYKNELKKLFNRFEKIRDEIQQSRKETEKLELRSKFNNSRIMFFSCVDYNNKVGIILWALRHSKDHYSLYNNLEDDEIIVFINKALNETNNLSGETKLKEYIDEVNYLTNELKDIYSIEDLKDKLTQIKENFNKATWKEMDNN